MNVLVRGPLKKEKSTDCEKQLISIPAGSFAKHRSAPKNDLRVLDLFAGAGGFGLGFELSGAEVKASIEIDSWACDTLRYNGQSTKVHQSDLTKISDEELSDIGAECNVIIGGPPCQGFSIANRKNDPNDPRNSLFKDFIRAISIIRPKAVLMENVPGLLSRKSKSNERVVDIIVREIESLGYNVGYRVIEAQSFGVPQIRPRLFVMATQEGLQPSFPSPTHSTTVYKNDLFNVEEALLPFVSVWDAISDLPAIEAREGADQTLYIEDASNAYQELLRANGASLYNHIAMRHSRRLVQRFSHVSWGESGMHAPAEHQARKRGDYSIISGKTYSQNNRRMHPDRPCHTIPASFYANFIHPYRNRNFTPREGARIQSFPDWYRFLGKPTVVSTKLLTREDRQEELHLCQYNQIGNAVPPLLAYHLAKHLEKLIRH